MHAAPPFSWQSLRANTPAADAFIHLNHASTSLPDQSVFDAQRDFLDLEASLGMHRAVDRMGDALTEVPALVARLIGAQPDHIDDRAASGRWELGTGRDNGLGPARPKPDTGGVPAAAKQLLR